MDYDTVLLKRVQDFCHTCREEAFELAKMTAGPHNNPMLEQYYRGKAMAFSEVWALCEQFIAALQKQQPHREA